MIFTTLELRQLRQAVTTQIHSMYSGDKATLNYLGLYNKITKELDAEDVGPSEENV